MTRDAVVDVDQAHVGVDEHLQPPVEEREQEPAGAAGAPRALDRGRVDADEVLPDLARGGERRPLALGLGPLVGRQVPAAMRRASVPTVPGASPIVAAEEVCTSRGDTGAGRGAHRGDRRRRR